MSRGLFAGRPRMTRRTAGPNGQIVVDLHDNTHIPFLSDPTITTTIGVNSMKVNGMRTGFWICLFCCSCFLAFAQQNSQMGQVEPPPSASATANHAITLDVVVADKGGQVAR